MIAAAVATSTTAADAPTRGEVARRLAAIH